MTCQRIFVQGGVMVADDYVVEKEIPSLIRATLT